MKEPLEIKAINIKHDLAINSEWETLKMWDSDEEIKISDILSKCDDKGFMKVEEKNKLKQFFQVRQILYRCQWGRFEQYDGDASRRVDFHNYIMTFDEFQKKGRPKKIYIDFYNSVSLTD